MSERLAASLQRILRADGVDASVRFHPTPAGGRFEFASTDGLRLYPLWMELTGETHVYIRPSSTGAASRARRLDNLMSLADTLAHRLRLLVPVAQLDNTTMTGIVNT